MKKFKNLRKIAFITIFFTAGSSFSFLPTAAEELSITSENKNINTIKLLDDNDVIAGYNNIELEISVNEIDQLSLDDILSANEISKMYENIKVSKTNLSKDDWNLVLVNKQHPVPEDYTFTLGTIKGNMKCDVRIIDELMDMMQAALDDGIKLLICSPYRDYSRQEVLFNRKIDYYMKEGYSYLDSYKLASQTVTVPGASEHQIGLALDIVSNMYSSLDTEFGETKAGIWLKEHCDEYGFILRYPLGKEYITGIQYEPWHFRYVGKEAATEIMKRGITLEEFLDEL